jgi:integral membrane sensor domain MASE1
MPLPVFAIVFAIVTELGRFVVPDGSTGTPAFWFPAGLLLGGLVVTERRAWGGVLAAGAAIIIASTVAHGAIPFMAAGIAVITAVQALLAAVILRRIIPAGFTLNRIGDAFAIVGSSLLAAAFGSLVPALLEPARLLPQWQVWGFSSAAGMLTCAPLLIAWWHEWRTHQELRTGARVWELAAVVVGGAIMSELVFGGLVPEPVQLPSLMLPFFLWAAFRFGPAASALTVFVICLIGLGHSASGTGPLAMPGAADMTILRAQATSGMAAVSFLLLASVAAERALALAEVKTLRGFIPICAWCHKVRDDEGFWQRLETYLGQNTDAVFSHSICPSCTDKQENAVTDHGGGTPWKI